MSLITRCPACATQFKVVPDQLKLSDGWVRCGHCSDVFDATRYLENWAPDSVATPSGNPQAFTEERRESPAPPPTASAPPAAAEASELKDGMAGVPSAPAQTNAAATPLDTDEIDRDFALDQPDPPQGFAQDPLGATSPASARLSAGTAAPETTPTREAVEAADFHAELKQFAQGLAKPPLSETPAVCAEGTASAPAKAPVAASIPEPEAALGAPVIEQSADQTADSPSLRQKTGEKWTTAVDSQPNPPRSDRPLEPDFMRQGRRRAFWRSPGMRVLLGAVALLLSALLVVQWALQERDRLAAHHPNWRPRLASLCKPLGCTIGAVRDLQAVEIDSSTLIRRIGDFYSFDLVLKNNATIPLAVPALELSLTDTADVVISRRVFLPEELPGVPPLLSPASSVPVSLRLTLAAGDDLPMAGYRALVFYP
jgi:predicted Zn finger-like uncharacterized protein